MTNSDRELARLLFENKEIIRRLVSERSEYYRSRARTARVRNDNSAVGLQEKAISYQHISDEIKRLTDAALQEIMDAAGMSDSKFIN